MLHLPQSIPPIIVILLSICTWRTAAVSCAQRHFAGADNNIVCVCNATYCDDIERIDSIAAGSAVVVVSSLEGDRFNRSIEKFGKKIGTADISMTVDARQSYQEIIGFGGAFTDSAGININGLSEGTQEQLMRAYFASTGIEYSLGRVPIASTDFSTREYSYADKKNDFDLTQFALAEEDLKYKIPYIVRALNLTGQSMRLFASPWSAPGWMKPSNKMQGGGALREGKEYHRTYANYFVRFFEEYAKHGVPFWGLTVQNEPTSGALPDYKWQTMFFTASTERDFVRDFLGPALKKNKLTKSLKVMSLDDGRIMLPGWADTVFNDSVASQYVDGVALHWYGNGFSPSFVLTTTHNRHPDKFLLATEACAGYSVPKGPILGDWYRAEQYATDIITDLVNWVAGWTDWNLCLDETGGPNWVDNVVDSPIIVNRTSDEFYKQPMYYAMGHFSKFLRPGSTRIAVKMEPDLPLVQATATVDKARRNLIILNRSSKVLNVNIGDAIENGEKILNLKLKAHSLYTVVWNKQ